MSTKVYWLKLEDRAWKRVTKEQYDLARAACGFKVIADPKLQGSYAFFTCFTPEVEAYGCISDGPLPAWLPGAAAANAQAG